MKMRRITTAEQLVSATKLRYASISGLTARDAASAEPRTRTQAKRIPLALALVRRSQFRDVDLSRCQIEEVDVRRTSFTRVCFDEARLELLTEGGSSFRDCSFVGTRFYDCDLGADGSRYERCRFVRTRFSDTNIYHGMFTDCLFEDCRFPGGALLFSSTFARCTFRGVLDDVTFGSARWDRLDDAFERFDYLCGRLRPNRMHEVDFSEARLWGVRFLDGVDLSTVKLPSDGRHRYFADWPQRAEALLQAAQAEGGVIQNEVERFLLILGSWYPDSWRPEEHQGSLSGLQQQYLLNLDWILELAGELAGPFILRQLGCEVVNSGEGASAP